MAKVVNPNNTTHSFEFIPRFEAQSNTLYLKNEATETETKIDSGIYEDQKNELVKITFDFDFVERDKYQICISDDDGEVVYRGKLFATEQKPQDFVITEGYIKY